MVRLFVYVRKQYHFTQKEKELQEIAKKYGGKWIGEGTNLSTGKRDIQFQFKTLDDDHDFLDDPKKKTITLRGQTFY